MSGIIIERELSLPRDWRSKRRFTNAGPRQPQWRGRLSALASLRSDGSVEAEAEAPKVAKAKKAECAVCFEPLCEAPIAAFWIGTKRACRHLFHLRCAEACPIKMGCPLCRAKYHEVGKVPDMSKTVQWFEAMDVDRNGRLDQNEVLFAVKASMPVDCDVLDEVLPVLWASLGKGPEDSLTYSELLGQGGLLTQLRQELQQRPAEQAAEATEESEERKCPELAIDKRGWFLHWDEDCSGVLEREEVVRGMAQAFKSDVPAEICRKRLRMRCIVESMWPLVDTDGNDRITLEEFCQKGGLADLIINKFIIEARSQPRSPRSKTRRTCRSPRRRLSPRRAREDDRWQCSTDLPDDGRWDAPWIIRRESIGFFSKEFRRRSCMQWSGAQADMGKWHAPVASPLPSDRAGQEPSTEEPRVFAAQCSGSGSGSDSDEEPVAAMRSEPVPAKRRGPWEPTQARRYGRRQLTHEHRSGATSQRVSQLKRGMAMPFEEMSVRREATVDPFLTI